MSGFELSKSDQFIIAGDFSGSTRTRDCLGGTLSRHEYIMEIMGVFIREATKWDEDGVSFYAFSSTLTTFKDVKSVDELIATIGKMKPGGNTNMHLAIQEAYAEHKAKGSKNTRLMILGDGEPTDPAAVEKAIVDITNDVKDEQEFRISILTVGQRTPELATWLANLDDNLTAAKYDIVSVDELEKVDFQQAVDNAIEG